MPVHKIVQIAMLADDISAGPQHQMKSISQNDLGTGSHEFLRRHGFDRAISTHRHECRGFYTASGKLQTPAPGRPIML
jgi:hypothetical protein